MDAPNNTPAPAPRETQTQTPRCDEIPRRDAFHHYVIDDWIKLAHTLELETAALRAELAGLRADRERLDWLQAQRHMEIYTCCDHKRILPLGEKTEHGGETLRAAIDSARALAGGSAEAQPSQPEGEAQT